MTVTKVKAEDLRPGDKFAATKSGTPDTVKAIPASSVGPKSRYIELEGGGRLRPRHTSPFYLFTDETQAVPAASDFPNEEDAAAVEPAAKPQPKGDRNAAALKAWETRRRNAAAREPVAA